MWFGSLQEFLPTTTLGQHMAQLRWARLRTGDQSTPFSPI
jgi:hypothetical protein